jgi:Transposase zinc-binding domain/Putative transposase
MNAPPFEVADIVRAAGKDFIEKNRSRLTWQHLRVLRAIERCRTAALGGHLDQCSRCGRQAISFNSCRNRHCGKCQTNARDQWLQDREKELLHVPYVHVVFTLPHQLSPLTLANKRVLYDLLLRASAATLLEIAADPKHLGAEIGFMSVLHTWGQNVLHHPHAHCVIPAGGLSLDHQHWVHPRYAFFLPVKVLSRVFRGKFTAGLKKAFRRRQLTFPVQRKVISVLRHDHMSQQTRASQATRNRAAGRFRLHDHIALAAAEFRAYVPDDFEASRNPFEHFRYVFTQFA